MASIVIPAAIALCMFAGLVVADSRGSTATAAAPASPGPSASLPGDAVVIRGASVAVTADAVAAYFEALEFVHAELGQPMHFEEPVRQHFVQTLAQNFAALPLDSQETLARARPLWTQYAQSWDALPMTDKQAFAYFVLALAYGEPQAAQALGIRPGGNGASGQPSIEGLDVDAPYEGSDCWASAGCDYDSGSETYTYDSYD